MIDFYEMDAVGGNSGSPLWYYGNSDHECNYACVIGIHAHGYVADDTAYNKGVRVNAQVILDLLTWGLEAGWWLMERESDDVDSRIQHVGRSDAAALVVKLEGDARKIGLPILNWQIGFRSVTGTPAPDDKAGEIDAFHNWRKYLGVKDEECHEEIDEMSHRIRAASWASMNESRILLVISVVILKNNP